MNLGRKGLSGSKRTGRDTANSVFCIAMAKRREVHRRVVQGFSLQRRLRMRSRPMSDNSGRHVRDIG